jgi:hypothetical protein
MRPVLWVVLMVALGSAACEAESSPPGDAPATVAESESSADADALRAAKATVRAFFSVKRHAQDDPSVQIDAQEAYLTARGVHPGAAFEAGWRGYPTGVDDIQIDFNFTGANVTYPVEGKELQLDAGAPGEFYWTGTATLENWNGEWLINDVATDSSGGSVG